MHPHPVGPIDLEWVVAGTFDTALACERARTERIAVERTRERAVVRKSVVPSARPPADRAGEVQAVREASADKRLAEAGRCVGAEDPWDQAVRETVIPFTPGQRIYVEARVNDTAGARLILDTGADRTIISPWVLLAAGVRDRDLIGRTDIFGVTGSATVEVYEIWSLEVGHAEVGGIRVLARELKAVAPLEALDAEGLLGRDFLDRFKVTIDSVAGQAVLRATEAQAAWQRDWKEFQLAYREARRLEADCRERGGRWDSDAWACVPPPSGPPARPPKPDQAVSDDDQQGRRLEFERRRQELCLQPYVVVPPICVGLPR